MNTIYTAGEVDPQALALLLKERDELRSALKARDEEIALMKDINRALVAKANRQNLHDARQSEVLTAQRKALELASTALETCTIARPFDLCIKDFDDKLVSAAMEEIERILK